MSQIATKVLPYYKLNISFAAAAKLMLNLHSFAQKKRPVVVLGETRPVDPDKGCVGEVLGTQYFLPKQLQRPRVEATFTDTLYLYEQLQRSPLQNVIHRAAARLSVYSLSR